MFPWANPTFKALLLLGLAGHGPHSYISIKQNSGDDESRDEDLAIGKSFFRPLVEDEVEGDVDQRMTKERP